MYLGVICVVDCGVSFLVGISIVDLGKIWVLWVMNV